MKAFLYTLLFLALFGIEAGAQGRKTTPASAQTENSLFWQISGNGLKAPSYMYGTYHFAGKSFIDSLGYIAPKLKSSKAVVGEVVIDQSELMKYMSLMTMTDNTLDKLFTPEEYARIAETNKQLTGTDIAAFNKFKPAALQTIWLTFIAQKTISDANQAMDIYFQEQGKAANNKVLGLETMDYQMNLLFTGSMESQKKHLLSFLQKKDQFKTESAQLYRLYQQQDLAGLNKLMFAGDEYTPTEMDALLKNRNLLWMEKLPAIISQQPTFIAVGAGHLVGEFGLINQLRLKGYTVTAIKN